MNVHDILGERLQLHMSKDGEGDGTGGSCLLFVIVDDSISKR